MMNDDDEKTNLTLLNEKRAIGQSIDVENLNAVLSQFRS